MADRIAVDGPGPPRPVGDAGARSYEQAEEPLRRGLRRRREHPRGGARRRARGCNGRLCVIAAPAAPEPLLVDDHDEALSAQGPGHRGRGWRPEKNDGQPGSPRRASTRSSGEVWDIGLPGGLDDLPRSSSTTGRFRARLAGETRPAFVERPIDMEERGAYSASPRCRRHPGELSEGGVNASRIPRGPRRRARGWGRAPRHRPRRISGCRSSSRCRCLIVAQDQPAQPELGAAALHAGLRPGGRLGGSRRVRWTPLSFDNFGPSSRSDDL